MIEKGDTVDYKGNWKSYTVTSIDRYNNIVELMREQDGDYQTTELSEVVK